MVDYIVTYTGKIFDFRNPAPEMVCIEDIAHSLAYQCRYTGHTRRFYSVAQHCVLMARSSDLPGEPLKKLLHDAAEAYIGDMASPWKSLLWVEFPNYYRTVKYVERKIQKIIGEALGVDLSYSAEVKEGDIRMAATEIWDLMPVMPPGFVWGIDCSNPSKKSIISWGPEFSEQQFLVTYYRLKEIV